MGAITDRGSRDSGGVNAHRWAAVHAIQDMKRKHPHLNIFLPKEKLSDNYSYLKFLTIMRDTKFFISPYGLGEFSGKDYESILSGAILVKPLAERIESYPNIYSSSMTIRTELQFDDLEEKVMPYLTKCSNDTDPEGCIRRKQEIEEFSKLNLIKLRRFMDLRNMADDWDRLLFSLASKKIEMKCGECLKPQKWMYTNEGVLLPREDVLLKAKMLDKQVSENFDDLYDREKMKWKSPDRADLQEAANYLAKGDEETSEQDDYQIILEDAK
uniref:Uncharacterized protein n=1 Tax=Tetraselmis sp. GSL018 TaxID=582737 RepID=A0A061RJS8_9CHLO